MSGVTHSQPGRRNVGRNRFHQLADAFLLADGLPFAEVLSGERIARVFKRHGGLFASGAIYSTAVTLWAFLGQVLNLACVARKRLCDGKQASCQSAVSGIISWCRLCGREAPTSDTGDYCRARAKLSEPALHELTCEVAAELEQSAGVGLPIARMVTIVSLATACVLDMTLGPYQGKQTGEPARLRKLLHRFGPGDVAVMDRYYGSYVMIAQLIARGAHVCVRKHHARRPSDFRKGRRLGKHDHIITWTKPRERPEWITAAEWAQIPEVLELREVRHQVTARGRRTEVVTLITTLLEATAFPKDELADLYAQRWHHELDLRSIKSNLNLAHVRCQTPEMVRREVWTSLLAYNLIRTTAAALHNSSALHEQTLTPRQISFTATGQHVLAGWESLGVVTLSPAAFKTYCRYLLEQIAACRVGHRPDRLEPRVLKRRRHHYPLMQRPRPDLRSQLAKQYT